MPNIPRSTLATIRMSFKNISQEVGSPTGVVPQAEPTVATRARKARGSDWRGIGTMGKRAACYGALLAAGTLALQWLDYQRLVRVYSGDVYTLLIAVAFLALGVFVGTRMIGASRSATFDGNPKAQAALGISPRELAVLMEIAAGRSNKEIAARLNVSPNTVKTHVARLFEKLGARRRTDAINRARELGIVP